MKALIILSHSRSPFSYLFIYMEKMNFCEALSALLEYFREKKKLLQFQDNSFETLLQNNPFQYNETR